MTTDYSVSVDNWDFESWTFTGRDLEEERLREKDDSAELEADDYYPMMLYAYPLHDRPSDEAIFKIHEETSLTVVMKNDTEEYFLALTGGGMDLSQDIGMAYIIAEDRIPFGLANAICTQPNLTQYGKDFRKVMKYCKDSIKIETSQALYHLKRINKAIKDSKEMDKLKLSHIAQLEKKRAEEKESKA